MALHVIDEIFSGNSKQVSNSTSARESINASETSPASRLLLKLSCESPGVIRRSPKKPNRIMAEKAVNTTKMRPERRATTPETPTKRPSKAGDRTVVRMLTCDCEPAARTKKSLRSSIASSQASFYEGDDELEEIFDKMEDDEVERLLDGPLNEKSQGSGSSGSSLSSTLSESTLVGSTDSSAIEKIDRRRKRTESLDDEYPSRRTKASSGQEDSSIFAKGPGAKDSGFQHCKEPLTISATHQRISKLDRPIPRNIRDPGHSAPVTSTSSIAVSAVAAVPTYDSSKTSAMDVSSKLSSTMSSSPRTVPNGATMFAKPLMMRAQEKLSANQTSSCSPVIVAHDESKQRLLDCHGIMKGVQFEIARGITQGWWSWDDVTDGVVEQLRGTNFEKAGKVANVIGKESKERLSQAVIETRQAIYAELDREHDAFLENKGRGLGLMGPWKSKENWHGGCIQLTCKLVFNKVTGKDQPPFFIRLNSFGIGKSNRAARRVTSLSILQVKFEEEALYDEKRLHEAMEHLSRDLVICGRRYVAFCTKEGKVFFVETKGDFQRQPKISMGDKFRMSYKRFVNTINPLKSNKDQAMNKWQARWQLILSTSRPVVEFEPDNIYLDVDDVYGGSFTNSPKQAENIMTDGCGFMNLTALRMIAAITNSASCPMVVQGRVAGAKGLWILHPSQEHRNDAEPPKIWIRKSQLKINIERKEAWDRSLRIFDLVRLPRLTVPSGLNMQTILNMSYNGVTDETFVNLMEEGLRKEIEALTKWDGENACIALSKAVESAGAIIASRRSRGAGGDARLYSYVRDEKDDDDDSVANCRLVERDPISGCSPSLYESARDMLLAGFTPLENSVLREKLKYILSQTTKAYLEKFHIPVPTSAEAFIAPDPYGVLEEGEIYFRCSTAVGDPTVCIDPHTFVGPVLVSRNPTRVASDVRKVVAVSHDQLLAYTDVIIFSVKGERSLASYLGGGDYDGDTVTVIAEPTLVHGFNNSAHVPEPQAVRESFEQQVEKVSQFLEKVKCLSTDEKYREVSKKVLQGLPDGKVGLYSKMHDNAVYEIGYNTETAVRLAYMFTTCLDAVKSGLRIKNDVFKQDSMKWNADRPECMHTAEEATRNQSRGRIGRKLQRSRKLGPFVLETLRKAAKELEDKALAEFESLSEKAESGNHWSKCDEDLAAPYETMKALVLGLKDKRGATDLLEDLERIEVFIGPLCDQYIREVGALFGNRSPRKNGMNETTSRSKSVTQINYDYSRKFEEGLSDCSLCMPKEWVREIKASYAHVYGTPKSKLGKAFGFAVAGDLLCAFKNRRKGGASISRECRDYLLINNSLVKLVCGE